MDRSLRTPGTEIGGFSAPQAMVRNDPKPASDSAGLRQSKANQYPAGSNRGIETGPIRADSGCGLMPGRKFINGAATLRSRRSGVGTPLQSVLLARQARARPQGLGVRYHPVALHG